MTLDRETPMEVLNQKIDNVSDRLDAHVAKYEATCLQLSELTALTSSNALAIGELVKETSDIVQLHKDLKGVTRIGRGVQSFGLWMLKWPLIGGGLYAVFNWALQHLPD